MRILGPYDSGTNFVLAELAYAFAASPGVRVCAGGLRAAFSATCEPFVWKHTPPWRLPRMDDAAAGDGDDFVFAMARDPLAWMVSMRKAPYTLALNATAPLAGRCTLVVRSRNADPLSSYREPFASLADAWNKYYRGYAARRVPLARYEDFVLRHAEAMRNLTAAVSSRATRGGAATAPPPPPGDAPANTGAAKAHGDSRDWFEARAYVADEAWLGEYSAAELSWACAALDATLLRRLGYSTCLEPEAPREARRHEQTVARGLTSPREWLARWQARATADRYRPANATLTRAPTLISPMMFHLSYTPEEELAANGGLMKGWRELNPEYDYHIFSERDCVEFVRAFGSAEDARAYAAIAMGAQHADVCRAHVLLHLGGVYADADLELRRPLRELVPANASAANLAGGGGVIWPYTFLAFSARHPIIERYVGRMTAAILAQVALLEAGELNDAASCRDAHSCVLEITGPMAFHRSYASLACRGESGGGWPSKRLPVASWPCVRSSDAQMAGVFWSSVDKDQSHDAEPLEHHACSRRGNRSERECGASHYSHGDTAASYFIASPSGPTRQRGEALAPSSAETPRDVAVEVRAPSRPQFYWLHIPKCGSTFLATLVSVACPSALRALYTDAGMLPARLYRLINNKHPDWDPTCALEHEAVPNHKDAHQLDLVLRAGCAVSPYFTVDSDIGLPHNTSAISRQWLSGRPWATGAKADGTGGGCQHAPPRPLPRFEMASVAVMLRAPFSRLVSGLLYNQLDVTFDDHGLVKELRARLPRDARAVFYALHACSIQSRLLSGVSSKVEHRLMDALEAWPGGRAPADGCTDAALARGLGKVRQLWPRNETNEDARTGDVPAGWDAFIERRGADVRAWQTREAWLVELATERLRAAAFVGLTTEWARSICVFNAQFRPDAPEASQSQLAKARAQDGANELRLKAEAEATLRARSLDGDPMDDAVYAEARALFEAKAARYGC